MSYKIQDAHILQMRPGDAILHRDGKFRAS